MEGHVVNYNNTLQQIQIDKRKICVTILNYGQALKKWNYIKIIQIKC